MDIDDDDEFGDLYTDVLRPLSASIPSSSSAPSPLSLPGGDRIPVKNPSPDRPLEGVAPSLGGEDPKGDWLPDNWNEDDGDNDDVPVPVANPKVKLEPWVLDRGAEARVSGSVRDATIRVEEGEGAVRVRKDEKVEIGDLDQDPVIPGVSAVPLVSNGDVKVSNADDWDSDSEDDLQIVLNDNSRHVPMGGVDDEEDGEEDLVIVTDEDQQHHHLHPAMEEQDWGEGELLPTADGERKEGLEAVKANGAVGNIAGGPRIGYSSHGFHPQHHSMYKYIRPGTATPVATTVGPPGQIRPPTVGSFGGRGRGDWRPPGVRGMPGASKSFHSGFGTGWANNSSRAFGSGLDFTLPSHKTIFDVGIESFEEKPWRYPGIDISDYFNFGLDEDKWKEYSKQLDQLRLESTMQSKIRVYESGRSEQNYDPDLPPELAAAAGHHDISADNMNHVKMDNGQSESGQGRSLPCIRAPFPPGRAIQVETGFGERLPSIDTRPPRTRDTDAIIEIVLQDPMEDSTTYNSASEQPEKNMRGAELKAVDDTEDDRHSESEYYDRIPQAFNGNHREVGTRRIPHTSEGDGVMPSPPESPPHVNPNYRLRSPRQPTGSFDKHRGGRSTEARCGRYSSTGGNHSNDDTPIRSAQENKHDNHQKERGNSEASQTPEPSPDIAAEAAGELSIEQKDSEHDDMLALGGSIEVEGEETSDIRISDEILGDDSIIQSSKKHKLSSQIEQTTAPHDAEEDDVSAPNSDNSRAKSGSSNQKQRESGDEEVQDGQSRRTGDVRSLHAEEGHTFRRKDDYGRESRHEMARKRTGSKGREVMHHSYPHRDWEPYPVHPVRGRSEGFERPREADSSFWQRREDDIHSRRIKDEDIRRECTEEAGSRNRGKVRVSDRNDSDIHLKKRLDDGDWRGRNREGGPRVRERDEMSSRRANLNDHQAKRKRDEEQSRRGRSERDDSVHGDRAREDTTRRKRERDVNPEHRREDSGPIRDQEDLHSSKHKDESLRQREREDKQRLKHPHDGTLLHRERGEGRGAARGGRAMDDKSLGGSARNKSDSKLLTSDKDYQHRDRRRHSEQSKRGDRIGEENDSQHKGRGDVHSREKHRNNEERSSRHERLTAHNDRPSASDNQQISRERHKEVTRKNKDTEGSMQNPRAVGKRKHEDYSAHRSEKISSKGLNEQEGNNVSNMVNQLPHSSEKQGEGDLASDDERQHESRRGRSKLERWTSHLERDFNATDNVQSSSSRAKMGEDSINDIVPTDDLPKIEGNNTSDADPKGVDGGMSADKSGDDKDRHWDTVEKLKRRSERFKLPMPGEKDVTLSKRPESDTQLTQNEALADTEVKPERPARKRRWTSN